MKVLHISHRDSGGGAAEAASRVHLSLLNAGIDSQMLVGEKITAIDGVTPINTGGAFIWWLLRKKVSRGLELLQRDNTSAFFSLNLFSNGILKRIGAINPDIVHLHWIGGEILKVEDMARVSKPIVWTLHDMWPYCGAEHLDLTETGPRWRNGYSRENRPPEARGIDWNRQVWIRKHRSWKGLGMNAVCVSRWGLQNLRQSALMRAGAFEDAKVIGNGIDTERFRPLDRNIARSRLRLPRNGCLLLFAAHQLNVLTKGADLLYSSLASLRGKLSFKLIVFGEGTVVVPDGIEIIRLGHLKDPVLIWQAYAAATLTLVPSRCESFGLVAAEALSCGVPVVCYDTSGLREVVDHQVTGYRARAFDTESFADGILWCLDSVERYQNLGLAGRSQVKRRYSITRIREKYVDLYSEILSKIQFR